MYSPLESARLQLFNIMTREELYKRLELVQGALNKVYKSLENTTMPVYEYISYLKWAIGLDIEKVEEK